VPAKFIMLLYEANVLVHELEEITKAGKKKRMETRYITTYVAFKECARESKIGRAKTQANQIVDLGQRRGGIHSRKMERGGRKSCCTLIYEAKREELHTFLVI
jgi:hypothetical protein